MSRTRQKTVDLVSVDEQRAWEQIRQRYVTAALQRWLVKKLTVTGRGYE